MQAGRIVQTYAGSEPESDKASPTCNPLLKVQLHSSILLQSSKEVESGTLSNTTSDLLIFK